MEAMSEVVCPYCKVKISEGGIIRTCDGCQTASHGDCWQEAGCSVNGCANSQISLPSNVTFRNEREEKAKAREKEQLERSLINKTLAAICIRAQALLGKRIKVRYHEESDRWRIANWSTSYLVIEHAYAWRFPAKWEIYDERLCTIVTEEIGKHLSGYKIELVLK